MNRRIIIVLLLSISFLCFGAAAGRFARATERGGGAYANGSEDFMSGAFPPPGTYIVNFFNYYHAGKLKDNKGNTSPVDFDLEAIADTVRFVHVTKQKVFGADWGMQILTPFVKVHVSTPGGIDSKTGIGDIVINPFLLGWHFTNWHITAGIDTVIPTGAYDKNDIANIGRNYWTFEPVIAATYMNTDGYEISGKFMYDFNTKNTATDYHSGQEFHFDYTIGKRIGNMNIGIGGYFYKQITDDSLNGNTIHDNKGQVLAFGPQFRYNLKNINLTLKYQWETLVKNRPEGEQFWFKLGYAF